MAEKLGPVFLLRLGIHKTLVVSNWEVARECFTVQDKVFATHPKSYALEIMGYDQSMLGFLPYGRNWMKEHRQKMNLSSIDEMEQDFMYVMLTLMDSDPSAQISDTSIKATCLNLLVGGFDTVMVTLTWAVSLLLNNSHVLRKVQDELEKYVGRDRQVNESDVKNLSYLRAIVKETFRLYLAAPLLAPHEAMEDCTLAGFHISAGTRLFVNLWKLQRDPGNWSNPLEFQPERFVEKHVDVDVFGKNFELIPFGSGRRACPGITFALQVLHLTLARFLHAFELGTVSDLPINMTESAGLTNPKATPLEVTFRPRLLPSLYL